MSELRDYALKMNNINKKFGDSLANNQVSLCVEKGKIHAIVGENGAGKSTLVKILYGYHKADSGDIYINGNKVAINNSEQAIGYGIGMVHQHFMLIEAMTILDNIVLGNPLLKLGMVIDYKSVRSKINALAKEYNFTFQLDDKVDALGVGSKQRLEIFKTIYRKTDILILDEPTSVLTKVEIKDLFKIIGILKKQGKSVIIITHKLGEVMEIADNVTVMRDAKVVANREIKNTSIAELAGLMVGREIIASRKEEVIAGDDVLVVENLTYQPQKSKKLLDNINLRIAKGEIVGIAGVSGNGQPELEQVLTGMIKTGVKGKLRYRGVNISQKTTAELRSSGLAHIPSDRNKWAYINEWVNYQNSILGYHAKRKYNIASCWFNFPVIKKMAKSLLDKYKVTPPSINYSTKSLSGGNQQKLIVGRELDSNPDLIIIAEPTHGVDIGSVEFIHGKILSARKAGKAILLISSELSELRKLSDRSFVICEGKIVDEINWQKDDDQSIGIKMIGGANAIKRN
ncbi:MAG: ABC transporter ATP-binding protein [SAR324 cluster bacterium]|nr:ABC transporter ATP-binding protein [SAR324 cluster bacterium]